jgi:ribose transport system substrate-binding protein
VGKLVKQAIPDGGEIVIFIGSLDQDNSKLRRQGTIDEIFDRSHDPTRYDPPGEVITDGKYTILETMVDEFDDQRKKAQPESALVKYAELDCMVGLFEYNPPNILEALRSADRLGVIKVVGFDENERTLRAIRDGHCIGTVVQDPYRYGFDSVRVLAALARGDTSVIPENKFISIPARTITADNVDAFEAELNERLAGSR